MPSGLAGLMTPDAYFQRGNACLEKGDYDNAMADYTQVLTIDPDNAGAKQGIEAVREKRWYSAKRSSAWYHLRCLR
jgi:tetratricopeptide (TPR) repeat protein